MQIELSNTDISQDFNCNLDTDPNSNYKIFSDKIQEIKSKHIPCKLVKFNKHKHKDKNSITYGILKSIRTRDKMHFELKTKQQNTPEYTTLKHNLRVFNTILKKSIREAKSLYYEAVFLEYKHDMKNTWKVISGILNKSNKKKSPIRQIFIDGKKTDDMKKIANGFNSFFVNIGPNLAKIIDTSNKKVFTSYLTKSITSSFNFSLINEEDTLKIISSLKTKHSSGHDGISVKLLKALAPSIVRPLTIILNQSLTTGIFPDLLKTAKVIPLFKKEDAEIVDY